MREQRSPRRGPERVRTCLAAIAGLMLSVSWAAAMSTGTGFAVASDGTLVTNEHVVSGCTSVRAHQGAQNFVGVIVATDHVNDLAIVKLRERTPSFARIRRGPAVRVGEQIVTYGFPLAGALTIEGNLTVGYVSALRGLRDDVKSIQITAPVQPGNSGGPLVDSSANVIGVVASKLDALKVMRTIGDVPQNVNFAVALDRLKRFLQDNNVTIADETSTDTLSPADIGDRVRRFTYLIECQKSSVAVAPTPLQVQARPGAPGAPADPMPPSSAQAACYNEIVATKQLLVATRVGIQATVQSPPETKCQAIRRYYTAMISARDVFSRCDTGDQRAEHAAALDASIDKFRQNMPPDCRP